MRFSLAVKRNEIVAQEFLRRPPREYGGVWESGDAKVGNRAYSHAWAEPW